MGTLPLIIRIAKLLWTCLPFIITVVFNDRPVKEVLRENFALTIVFILFIVMTFTAFFMTQTLGRISSDHIHLEEKARMYEETIARQASQIKRQRSELESYAEEEDEEDYDPARTLRRLMR